MCFLSSNASGLAELCMDPKLSPKTDIDGSEVYRVYYEEQETDRIITYCEKDTIAVAQIFLRLRGDELLTEDEIIQV